MLKIIILLLLTLAPHISIADAPTYLEIHIGSRHVDDGWANGDGTTTPYNEYNFGLGINIPSSVLTRSYRVGFFENSFNRTSVYGVIDFHSIPTYGMSYGLLVGLTTGYKDSYTNTDVLILVIPTVSYTYSRLKYEVSLVPNPDSPTLTFTIGISFR